MSPNKTVHVIALQTPSIVLHAKDPISQYFWVTKMKRLAVIFAHTFTIEYLLAVNVF